MNYANNFPNHGNTSSRKLESLPLSGIIDIKRDHEGENMDKTNWENARQYKELGNDVVKYG